MSNLETVLLLQGHQIELSKLTLAFNELKETIAKKTKYENMPEWVNLDLAIKLKGGCSPAHIKNRQFLQPCCGRNYKSVGGRKCWRLNDIIEWIDISDNELKQYAKKWKVNIPKQYEDRSLA